MDQKQIFRRLCAELGYSSMAAMARACKYNDSTLRIYLSEKRLIYGHTIFTTLIRLKHPEIELVFDQSGVITNFKIKGDQNG